MKSKTASKLILTLLIAACAAYGLSYLLTAIESKSAVVEVQRAKEEQSKNFEFGNHLRENLKILSEQEAQIQSTFIAGENMIGFIQTLESTANQNGLKISIDRVEQGEAQLLAGSIGKTIPVTFAVQTEGSYGQTRTFIDQILNLEKRLGLSQVNLYRAGDAGYTARMTVTGIILSYE